MYVVCPYLFYSYEGVFVNRQKSGLRGDESRRNGHYQSESEDLR